MSDIQDIPATLLDADFSEEELVEDAMNAFAARHIVSREPSMEDTIKVEDDSIEIPNSRATTATATSDSAASKKRSWRKPGDKPKRPLSAYNLFFQLERQRLISDCGDSSPYTAEDVANVSRAHKLKKEKRRHRKTHGKISFADLARTIAQKWKSLEPSDKVVFEQRAEIEKARYKEDLEEWNIKQQQSFNQRKASMLRKVSLEPSPGLSSHLDKSSGMGMGLSNGMPSSYTNALSQARSPYDLGGVYGGSHEASLQEEASLQQSLMQRQSLARYQALMEQQLDQASLDQMVLGYSGSAAASSTAAMSGLHSRHPYLGASASSALASGYGGSYYYDDEYDYNDLAQAYGTGASALGRSSVVQSIANSRTAPSRIQETAREVSLGPSQTSDQQYYSSLDCSTSSHHSEHTRANASYQQQTNMPHSAPAPVEDALTLDPHQGMSSPVLEANDGQRMDPFNSMHVI